MTPIEIITQLRAVERSLLAQLQFNSSPVETLPTGQITWSKDQILNKDQIKPGMVLVRVVGVDQVQQTVIAVSIPFEVSSSWWYNAISLEEPKQIRKYSLGDAGVVQSSGGWSENYLLDAGHSVDLATLPLLLRDAKAYP